MADYVTDGKIGIDLTATYASTSVGSTTTLPATPGTIVSTSNWGRYIFSRAASTVSAYDCVIFSTFGDSASATPIPAAVPITTTNAALYGLGTQVGFAQNAVASAYYGWFMIQGQPKVNLTAGAQPKLPLFTTATAGVLDSAATVSAGWVQGIVANTSATSASAPYCIANSPKLGRYGAAI